MPLVTEVGLDSGDIVLDGDPARPKGVQHPPPLLADTVHLRDVAMATTIWLSACRVHIGATWRIRLNRPCAAAMRPYVKLL